MSTPTRVRFAPSPTGLLHVGGVRSALFNWLWARHTGGQFVLRLEDTDRARLVEGAAEQINDSLERLGIAPDEGPKQGGKFSPYTQSERLNLYREYADKLVDSGDLYPCWCSAERLTGLREAAQKAGVAFKYDRHCLDPKNHQSKDEPHVLRFKIPEEPARIGWDDAVKGRLEFGIDELDDFVALKSDGYPTYHLANVIDDHLMEITHVLRADEWVPSTPKHALLYQAFGWEMPVFGHLPAVQGPDGKKKLSKRDGAQSVGEYLEEGYLREALMSFLASLGWNDGTTQEVYTPDELVEKFTLDRIQKSPAMFDKERLTWINGKMIREMPLPELAKRTEGFWPDGAGNTTPEYRQAVLGLVQERLKFLSELAELTEFFFADPAYPSGLLDAGMERPLKEARGVLGNSDFTEADLESRLRALAEKLELKPGQLFTALRSAVTGRKAAPGIFETLHTLGRDTTLRRIDAALAAINR